eukprot:CAMPEP_0116006950 /NCGR_PEP_ID=MMETSP0321-20121206/2020_1 /TAXON_ID=163516 /ORGANISM="Leptocylindrus danicus var. danicus, Strain B650" /LENGTH=411 /DNA_ID=CAMNT_0003475575 /DNA_START=211 /DNA_END=1446 /DNA_ORIENTATION=+
MKQVASLPSSIMSSEKAIADIGFEYLLGKTNVFQGTAWHKRILKDEIFDSSKFKPSFLPSLRAELAKAMENEIKNLATPAKSSTLIPDLFGFVRRVVLRTMLNKLIGLYLNDDDETALLDDIMSFQDIVEDATATAAVMAGFVARPFVLRPVERRRKSIEKIIAGEKVWSNNPLKGQWGPWLRIFYESRTSSEEAATLVVGLMFAAHKNPAIGATQSFCYLLSEGSRSDIDQARNEAKHLMRSTSFSTSDIVEAHTLRQYVLETVRMTSHSIGALRKACKDVVLVDSSLREYTIRQGETVAISHITMHRNNSIWKDGEKFDAHREEWASVADTDDISVPIDNYKMTAFSHGTNKCPGERLAIALMEIVLALLLDKDVQINGGVPPISFERATLAQRPRKISAVLTINVSSS